MEERGKGRVADFFLQIVETALLMGWLKTVLPGERPESSPLRLSFVSSFSWLYRGF